MVSSNEVRNTSKRRSKCTATIRTKGKKQHGEGLPCIIHHKPCLRPIEHRPSKQKDHYWLLIMSAIKETKNCAFAPIHHPVNCTAMLYSLLASGLVAAREGICSSTARARTAWDNRSGDGRNGSTSAKASRTARDNRNRDGRNGSTDAKARTITRSITSPGGWE